MPSGVHRASRSHGIRLGCPRAISRDQRVADHIPRIEDLEGVRSAQRHGDLATPNRASFGGKNRSRRACGGQWCHSSA